MSQADKCEAAITRHQRKMAIKVNLEQLLRRPPTAWANWDTQQTRHYLDLARRVRRMGEGTPWGHMVLTATQLAELHGVPMATIDPGHGSAA